MTAPNNAHRSRIEGFYKLDRQDRLIKLAEAAGLADADVADLTSPAPLPFEAAEHMIENTIGVIGLPLGVGLNFLINGRDRIIPMAIEEPSVIAAVSFAARLIR